MPAPGVLKMVNRRLAELTEEYTAIRKGGPPRAGNHRGTFADSTRPGRNPKDTGKAWALRPTAKELAFRESDALATNG